MTHTNVSKPANPNADGEPPKTKAEEITAILRDEILTGQYRPGERMPSERDLAARFEANRGAIRESLKKLEQLGIASITPGGVRVVPLRDASLSILGPLVDLQESPDPLMAKQMLQVLGTLVSMSASAALERATDSEVDEMQTIIQDLIDHNQDHEYQENRWRDLGNLFTEVSQNLVLRLILNGLKTQFIDRLGNKGHFALEFDYDARTRILRDLKHAMQHRDVRRVTDAVNEHFELINFTLQQALQRTAAQSQQSHTI